MADANLTEEELREVAAEAGISPQELRMALAQRGQNLPVRTHARAVMGPPSRGMSAAYAEMRLALAPDRALASVRKALERRTGLRGHEQGAGQADIVDEEAGLTYRIRSESDGAEGALVRIDVDPSAARGMQALIIASVLAMSMAMVLAGAAFSTTVVLAGLALGVIGGLWVFSRTGTQRKAIAEAQATAAQALVEAESPPPTSGSLG